MKILRGRTERTFNIDTKSSENDDNIISMNQLIDLVTKTDASTVYELMSYIQYPSEFTSRYGMDGFECIDSEVMQEETSHNVDNFHRDIHVMLIIKSFNNVTLLQILNVEIVIHDF